MPPRISGHHYLLDRNLCMHFMIKLKLQFSAKTLKDLNLPHTVDSTIFGHGFVTIEPTRGKLLLQICSCEMQERVQRGGNSLSVETFR